jgi:DNA-binding NarL/FixJ family response regulator
VIRVLLADDHPSVRHALEGLLAGLHDIEWVASAINGADAIELAYRHTPDVVVMDVAMPILDGIAATILIRARHPNTRVVIFSGSGSSDRRAQATIAGASAYLLKDESPETLLTAIRSAATSL